MSGRERKPYWNAYFGGAVLGVVLFVSFMLTGQGLERQNSDSRPGRTICIKVPHNENTLALHNGVRHKLCCFADPGQVPGWKQGAKIKRQFLRLRYSTRQQDAPEYRVHVIAEPVFIDAVVVGGLVIEINRALANGGLPGHAGKLEKQFLPRRCR